MKLLAAFLTALLALTATAQGQTTPKAATATRTAPMQSDKSKLTDLDVIRAIEMMIAQAGDEFTQSRLLVLQTQGSVQQKRAFLTSTNPKIPSRIESVFENLTPQVVQCRTPVAYPCEKHCDPEGKHCIRTICVDPPVCEPCNKQC